MTRDHLQLWPGPETVHARRSWFLPLALGALAALSLSGCIGLTDNKIAPQLVVTPSAITFQNVIVGQKNTQTVQVSNNGEAELDITAITLTGSGFSLGPVSAPLKLAPSASKNFTVSFAPTATTTAAKAIISIASNDATATVTVPVSGTSIKSAVAWELTPAALAFPSITVQASKSQSVTVSNTGNSPLTIGSVATTGTAFSVSGINGGTTLGAGQQLSFQVTFHPLSAGNNTGTLKLTSASVAALNMSLSGQASAASTPASVPHTVTLFWNPSSAGGVVGYHVYRGTTSGGPYFGLNSSLDSATSYVDSSVVSGGKYFYVATAVDSTGNESAYSNEASATIPNP